MTSFLTGEDEEAEEEEQKILPSSPEEYTPTHSHRRRWSTPIDSCNESLQSFTVIRSTSSDHEFFSCSSENSNSFYGKNSPWGPLGPPLLTHKTRSNAPTPPHHTTEKRGRSRTRNELPPFLTTLDCNGRPRFHHRRVRSEGRLEIASVAVDLPEIVSVRGREGLRIGTVRINQNQS